MNDFITDTMPSLQPQRGDGFHGLIACRYCDMLHVRESLGHGQTASCRRCGSTLYRNDRHRRDARLPLVLAALLFFIFSNLYPIAEINLQGVRVQSTLWGCVRRMYLDQMELLAIFLFVTILLFPVIELVLMAWVLMRTGHRRSRPGGRMLRLLNRLRPWSMIEIYMLGVLVTLSKLTSMATVVIGPASISMVLLVVTLAGILMFDSHDLWE